MYIEKNDKKNGKIVDISSKYDIKIVFDDKEDFENMMNKLAFFFDYFDNNLLFDEEQYVEEKIIDLFEHLEERYDSNKTYLSFQEYIDICDLFWYAVDRAINSEKFALLVASDYLEYLCTEVRATRHSRKKKKNDYDSSLVKEALPNSINNSKKKQFIVDQSLFIVSSLLEVALANKDKEDINFNIHDMFDYIAYLEEEEKDSCEDNEFYLEDAKKHLHELQDDYITEAKKQRKYEEKVNRKINEMSESFSNVAKKEICQTLGNLVKKGVLDISDAVLSP